MLTAIDLHKVLLQSQDTIPLFSTPEKSLRRKYNQFDFDKKKPSEFFIATRLKNLYRLSFALLDLDYFKGDILLKPLKA